MELAPPSAWQKQPERETVVWQHNSLAEARYELTAREQKLLLYVIAMIEPEDEDFKRYVVNVSEFADLAGLDEDHLYQELRDLAKSLKQKPLIIPHHFDHQTKSYLDLVTSWFDTAYVGKNGAGYFAVTLSPVLKPYLLQVKREFFHFRLYQVDATPVWLRHSALPMGKTLGISEIDRNFGSRSSECSWRQQPGRIRGL
ncbi:MAG: replication initiation protein [Verrucomicrobia bacterium]|nr:replication initiation protein [Verrucomicrobiota bacterium]